MPPSVTHLVLLQPILKFPFPTDVLTGGLFLLPPLPLFFGDGGAGGRGGGRVVSSHTFVVVAVAT